MQSKVEAVRPGWVSDDLFPFESRFYSTPAGHHMHYVDEGQGKPVVFVHGNPTWSFEFRKLIAGLRSSYRCIAADHIGFGLSSRSDRREDFHPAAHADNLSALLVDLDLAEITLYLTDWGGPIGLDFARKHQDKVSKVVIANSWCWPVAGDFHFEMFSFMMSSFIGQFLIRQFNLFVNQVMPRAVGNRECLSQDVMKHYRMALPTPEARAACAALPGHIIGANDWLKEVWEGRSSFISIPALVLWGFRDIAFRHKELAVWQRELKDCEVHEFRNDGHFLAEEIPERLLPVLRSFLECES